MKILFLDFDGVLNNSNTRTEDTWDTVMGFDHQSCILLRFFVNQNNIHIIVSSTWRYNWEQARACLIAIGIFPQLILGHTRINSDNRADQIRFELDKFKPVYWAAIDDEQLTSLGNNWVETHDDIGLRTIHIEELARILSVEIPEQIRDLIQREKEDS